MSYHNGPRIVTDGLVLYLDAGNSKSYTGSGTVWNDLSGNGNNGTLINGPTYSSLNKGSINFDGINDHCRITIPALSNTEFSCDCFVFPTVASSLNDLETIIAKFHGLNRWNFRLSLGDFFLNNNTELRCNVRPFDGISDGITSGPPLSLNQWYHIAFTIKELESVSLYLNGNLISSSPLIYAMPSSVTNDIYICSSDPVLDMSRFFGGMRISNLRLYNKKLSLENIQTNYNALKSRYNL